MNPRKENSTNHINELYWKDRCGIAFTLVTIGGRWKINILSYLLNEGKLRYSELRKRLVGISERMLIAKLKELEHDKLINRIVYQQVPPKVEYELTELGRSLEEILNLMDKWGEDNLPESML
ncbi:MULTISPECIES: winged helix-turn-helix transcriptional regulator [Sphingobacterium]|uniref:winged helix-turn-helix transcriptional regulator n=1 Tax=Sphingobacterium TaxID=28453 RepID=UPI0008A22550|nr:MULTISPECIES: winged helix-turn-helix transcriptional regulator [Sphingobacterium]OFV21627.1 transcriptional regulator [Sphingobacterium sp. HMSC13C05]HAE68775.1 transcriptional regulator [Sphingobacterium sp.]HAL54269.1 transcriptional regulator [Sphingobacterium sp.]